MTELLKQFEEFPECQFLDMNTNIISHIKGMGDNAIYNFLNFDQRSLNLYEEISKYPQLNNQVYKDKDMSPNQVLNIMFWVTHYKMVQKFYSVVMKHKAYSWTTPIKNSNK